MNKFAEAIAEHDANYQPPPENRAASERQPTPEKLAPRDMLFELHPHTEEIVSGEESLVASRDALSRHRSEAMSALDIERADADLMLYSNQTAQKPSAELEKRALKKRANVKAKRERAETDFARAMATTPGPMLAPIMEWANSPAIFETYVRAETQTDIREGETAMEAGARLILELEGLRQQKRQLAKAQIPADAVTERARQLVYRAARNAKLDQTIGALRGVKFDEARGFSHRSPPIPQSGAFEILCSLLPDMMAAALATRALEGHNAATALDDVERMDALNRIEDRESAIQYAAEANFRWARERGENPGPRIGGSVLAVLDLVKA